MKMCGGGANSFMVCKKKELSMGKGGGALTVSLKKRSCVDRCFVPCERLSASRRGGMKRLALYRTRTM